MATKIDTCGLSCPQPVLMFMNEVKKDADGEFDVLVDKVNDVVRLEIRRN